MDRLKPAWPELPYAAWKDTYATLHLWTQVVGKIRLVQTPWLNHSWHVVLYVSPRGLTTSAIPYGDRTFQLDFDFLNHVLLASTDDGSHREVGLSPRPVAEFYADLMQSLAELDIEIHISEMPNELPGPIRFSEDRTHASYDPDYAQRLWRILVQVERVLYAFRADEPRARGVPRRLHRQVQPRPFLLGELRPGGHALFGAASSASPGRRALPS
jgi:hypothetical protein